MQIIHVLADFKYGTTRWIIAHADMGLAWIFNIVVSLGLVAASSALVVSGLAC